MQKDLREKLAAHGLKATPQRVAIYNILMRSKDHPAADDLYEQVRAELPYISFDTVYRTLLAFSEAGLIKQVEGYGEKKRFDPDLAQHHHFRCVKCHKIVDFDCRDYDKLAVPDEINRRFRITGKRVVLEGLCRECGKQGRG